MALHRDDNEDVCRQIRDDINDLVSAMDGINQDIRDVREIIVDVENLLIDLRVTLNNDNNPEFRRRIRSEILTAEGTRDSARQKLFELEAAHEGLSRQLNSLRGRAIATGC